jgi:hypothetical protein
METSVEVPQKSEDRTAIWPRDPTPELAQRISVRHTIEIPAHPCWFKSSSQLSRYYFTFCYAKFIVQGDSLRQFQIGLYCTLVRSPLPSLPLDSLPAPLKTIKRGFIVVFCTSIWSLSTIFPHLNLLHSPSLLPQVPPPTHTRDLFYGPFFHY